MTTADEYLALEQQSPDKHEYIAGQIHAREVGPLHHNIIAASAGAALVALARGTTCRVFNSDQRIHVLSTGAYIYADAGVLGGQPLYHARDGMSLLNPILLVEVLSGATEAYDRGEKLSHYRRCESVRDVLLVWQSESRVEHHRRLEDDEWLVREHRTGVVELHALGVVLSLAALYEQVDWSVGEDVE